MVLPRPHRGRDRIQRQDDDHVAHRPPVRDGRPPKHVVAGNIGFPFSDYVDDLDAETAVVLEVSSFQLDHIVTFRPAVSVLLNITPDHLDRYGHDFGRYAAAKFRIFENQQPGDWLVYSADDVSSATTSPPGPASVGSPRSGSRPTPSPRPAPLSARAPTAPSASSWPFPLTAPPAPPSPKRIS